MLLASPNVALGRARIITRLAPVAITQLCWRDDKRWERTFFFFIFFLSGNDLKLSRTREKSAYGKREKAEIRFLLANGVEKRALGLPTVRVVASYQFNPSTDEWTDRFS